MANKRKLAMVKREKTEKLYTTFSKRRQALFNKAANFCNLSNAQVAILVSSPSTSKVYSFGHTSVDAVLEAFLAGGAPPVMDNQSNILKSAFSLGEEIQALESTIKLLMKKRKIVGNQGEVFKVFEEFDESHSVDLLQAIVDSLQTLLQKTKSKLRSTTTTPPRELLAATAPAVTCEGNIPLPLRGIGSSVESQLCDDNLGMELLVKSPDHDYLWTDPPFCIGTSYNGTNLFPTDDIDGNPQWIVCGSPSAFSYNSNYVPEYTYCNSSQWTTNHELDSGFTCDKDNAFPTDNIVTDIL